jgi:hypothetical protein
MVARCEVEGCGQGWCRIVGIFLSLLLLLVLFMLGALILLGALSSLRMLDSFIYKPG